MAIRIPSSKTYDRQNPKVRDNVIERIEVGALEVVPDNEYETPVYNEDFSCTDSNLSNETISNKELDARMYYVSQSGVKLRIYSVSYVAFNNQKTLNVDIQIPVLGNNKYINKIYTLLNKNDEPYIKYSITGRKKTGTATAKWAYSATDPATGHITKFTVEEGNIVYSEPFTNEEIVGLTFDEKISFTEDKYASTFLETSASQELKQWGNIKDATSTLKTIDGKEYYTLSLKLMAGVRTVRMGYSKYLNDGSTPSNIELSGEYVLYEPETIEITIYGNTIGIDLTDKTVYINGETQKKVNSVDGNELMQTTNYLLDGGVNAIETMYGETRKEYERGKETATIRCSIGDYYDYDSGEKMIAIDNSTGKMSFKMYDQIIPMVYGADGKDRPMSIYQDGSPKVFQVLGSKIFYDGAVWQELSLQELDKSEIV